MTTPRFVSLFGGLAGVLSIWMMAIFIFVIVVGWHLFRDMLIIYERAVQVEHNNHRSHHLHEREVQIRQMVALTSSFLVTGSQRYIQQYRSISANIDRAVAPEDDLYGDNAAIRRALQPIDRIADEIFTLPFATSNMEGAILMQELEGLLDQLSQTLSERHRTMDLEVNSSIHMITALHLDMRYDFMVAMLLLLLLLIAISIFLYRRVVYPLGLLRIEVARIGQGDFAPNSPDFGDNELGELSHALNQMGSALEQRNNDLIQAKSVAAHQEKMHALGLMTSSIAHEVGNPLSAVTVSLDVCREKLHRGEVDEVQRYLDTAKNELRRTENIIRSVLDFGRRSSDEYHYIDIATVIKSALHLVQLSHSNKRLKFELMVSDRVTMPYGNEDMVRQVLVNLLLNAADVSQEHGVIIISVDNQGDNLYVDVIDQGGGIPSAMCDKIFSPFFTTKSKGEGSGLG
ncbi:MAG: ATP-binding protein, partial [Mariprofundales bacterium]|nr:ATP-binding protein [Mariprofundales bacterium]